MRGLAPFSSLPFFPLPFHYCGTMVAVPIRILLERLSKNEVEPRAWTAAGP